MCDSLNPSIVKVHADGGTDSGLLVSDTGLVATNGFARPFGLLPETREKEVRAGMTVVAVGSPVAVALETAGPSSIPRLASRARGDCAQDRRRYASLARGAGRDSSRPNRPGLGAVNCWQSIRHVLSDGFTLIYMTAAARRVLCRGAHRAFVARDSRVPPSMARVAAVPPITTN